MVWCIEGGFIMTQGPGVPVPAAAAPLPLFASQSANSVSSDSPLNRMEGCIDSFILQLKEAEFNTKKEETMNNFKHYNIPYNDQSLYSATINGLSNDIFATTIVSLNIGLDEGKSLRADLTSYARQQLKAKFPEPK